MKINLSIDDVCPHSESSAECIENCFPLIKKYPNIKFTLFVPTAYKRNRQEPHYDIREHKSFLDCIQNLPLSNFEFGYHGHFHGGKNMPEFKGIKEARALELLDLCRSIFGEVGIPVQPIFRPPAFFLSPGGFAACQSFGIKVLSLYPTGKLRKKYNGVESTYDRVIYVNAHPREHKRNIAPPPYEDLVDPMMIRKHTSLSIMYHACKWDRNYFSVNLANLLDEFIDANKPEFCFLEQL